MSTPFQTSPCVGCNISLTYPANSPIIQCPQCGSQMQIQPLIQQAPVPVPPMQQMQYVNSTQQPHYINCANCQTLLSYAPSATATTIQCPKCMTLMEIPPSINQPILPGNIPTGIPSASTLSSFPPPSSASSSSSSSSSAPAPSTSHSKKKRKDPTAPKRSSNAYMIFCKEHRQQLKGSDPSIPFGKLGQKLGEMWRAMSTEEKAPYEEKASNDRDRYKEQMNVYQSEHMRKQVAGQLGLAVVPSPIKDEDKRRDPLPFITAALPISQPQANGISNNNIINNNSGSASSSNSSTVNGTPLPPELYNQLQQQQQQQLLFQQQQQSQPQQQLQTLQFT